MNFCGWTILEIVGNGRKGREVGNADFCLDVTFGGCETPWEECDSGDDTTGRDMANVTVAKMRGEEAGRGRNEN